VPVAQLTVHIAGRGLVVRHLRLPAAGRDSRFAVPCPSDTDALRNPLHNMYKPLPTMLKRRKLSAIKLTNFGFNH
jgi:hypothetical protein